MSFITDFVKYHEGNECPRDYIIWSGYAAISTIIGPRVKIEIPHVPIYADLLVCLVGESGNRKSFARNSAAALVKEVDPTAILCATQETSQGIVAFLAKDEQIRWCIDYTGERVSYRPFGIFASELANWINIDPARMATFITDIVDKYDEGYTYRLKKEMTTLPHPFITMLACAVPEWITHQIKTDEFCAGFGRRIIFICNDEENRKWPTLSAESQEARARCVARLARIKELHGTFTIDPDALVWFKAWYNSLQMPSDAFLRAWTRTQNIHTLRLAMLNSLAEKDDLVITRSNFLVALALLEGVKSKLYLLTDTMGRSEVANAAKITLSVIANNGGRMSSANSQMMTIRYFKNPMEQYSTFRYLVSSKQLAVEIDETGQEFYRLTKINGEEKKIEATPSLDETQDKL